MPDIFNPKQFRFQVKLYLSLRKRGRKPLREDHKLKIAALVLTAIPEPDRFVSPN